MTVRIYQSTDVGAPQLATSGDASSFITVLKACLVAGYGSKTAAGWSIEWESAGSDQIAFKMGVAGTGQILVIDGTEDYRHVKVFGCSSLTDINTDVVEKYYVSGTQDEYWYVRAFNSTSYNDWVVIASDTFVYYFNRGFNGNNICAAFFGDYDCVNQTWDYRTAITSHSSGSADAINYGQRGLIFRERDFIKLRRSWSGFINNNEKADDIETGHTDKNGIGVNPLSGKIKLVDADLHSRGVHMGKFPNAYYVDKPYRYNGQDPIFPYSGVLISAVDSPTGKPFFVIGGDDSGHSFLAIEYDE